MTTVSNLRPVPPAATPADRLAAAQAVIAQIRRERVQALIGVLIDAQEMCADISAREAGYPPGIAEIAARLLRPLHLAELDLAALAERTR